MKTPIHQILNVSPRYYEERILFGSFFLWCELNSHDDRSLQNTVANTAIFNWWLQEYRKLEDEFRHDVAPYIGMVDQKYISKMHVDHTIKIRRFYPKALLKTAQKTNIVCASNN